MSLSERFTRMEQTRQPIVAPVNHQTVAFIQRKDNVNARSKAGRQAAVNARRTGMNSQGAVRSTQVQVVRGNRGGSKVGRGTNSSGKGRGGKAQGARPSESGALMAKRNSQTTSNKASVQQAVKQKSKDGGRVGRGRGAWRGGRGGRGGRDRGKGGGDKVKDTMEVDAATLDESMDTYWFEAGKGPDPTVAKLDRGLDSYWSKAGASSNASGNQGQEGALGGGVGGHEEKNQAAVQSDAAEPSEAGNDMDPDL